MAQIEIMRIGGRYEMCDIEYRGEKYIAVTAPDDQELICKNKLGAWCEVASRDLINDIEHMRSTIDSLMDAANEYEQAPVIRAFLRQQSKATS